MSACLLCFHSLSCPCCNSALPCDSHPPLPQQRAPGSVTWSFALWSTQCLTYWEGCRCHTKQHRKEGGKEGRRGERSGRGRAEEAYGRGPCVLCTAEGFIYSLKLQDKHACPFMQGDLSPSNSPKLVSGKNQGLGLLAPGSGLPVIIVPGRVSTPTSGLWAERLWGQRLSWAAPLPFLGTRTQAVSSLPPWSWPPASPLLHCRSASTTRRAAWLPPWGHLCSPLPVGSQQKHLSSY